MAYDFEKKLQHSHQFDWLISAKTGFFVNQAVVDPRRAYKMAALRFLLRLLLSFVKPMTFENNDL